MRKGAPKGMTNDMSKQPAVKVGSAPFVSSWQNHNPGSSMAGMPSVIPPPGGDGVEKSQLPINKSRRGFFKGRHARGM